MSLAKFLKIMTFPALLDRDLGWHLKISSKLHKKNEGFQGKPLWLGLLFWPFWFAVLWLTKSQFAGNRSISPASKFSIFPLPWWKNLSFPTSFPPFSPLFWVNFPSPLHWRRLRPIRWAPKTGATSARRRAPPTAALRPTAATSEKYRSYIDISTINMV